MMEERDNERCQCRKINVVNAMRENQHDVNMVNQPTYMMRPDDHIDATICANKYKTDDKSIDP